MFVSSSPFVALSFSHYRPESLKNFEADMTNPNFKDHVYDEIRLKDSIGKRACEENRIRNGEFTRRLRLSVLRLTVCNLQHTTKHFLLYTICLMFESFSSILEQLSNSCSITNALKLLLKVIFN